jgi:AraC family transcriptional regulator, regulatory protein of adaptative response / methylated-DNA-[protein]-cysteine methyltransferase
MTPPQQKPDQSFDEQCWQQLGNASADGKFIYAVITTGIYCRPTCPSRRPNRDNVRFFNNDKEAEQAGFRPCKRCHPQHTDSNKVITDRVTRLCRYIENATEEPTLEELAACAGISAYHLQRQFKAVTGFSPKAYARAHRQKIMSAEKQKLTAIRFTCVDCSLGKLLVAHTEKGICAVLLGDDESELIADLKRRFPKTDIQQNEIDFAKRTQQLLHFIETPQQAFNLPLDIRGTLFQQQVWQALQEIPIGETRSYSDIATAIGSPKAVRAVAGACAANALAIAIPCHRVVRSDGELSGYRWGTERKKTLLQREADVKKPDQNP